MTDSLSDRIVQHVKSDAYRPIKPRQLAKQLEVSSEQEYSSFRESLRELMHAGRVVLGAGGSVVLPTQKSSTNEMVGIYHGKKGGFGFVVPTDPGSHEDLYVPRGDNAGAITGDTVRAKITNRRPGATGQLIEGRVTEIVERSTKRFVGTLSKQHGQWVVLPDGNMILDPILAPDAASRHIRIGTKVVIELTQFPERNQQGQGVIVEVLGAAGEKDVDLKSVIVQFNLPGEFPDEVQSQARRSVDSFDPETERHARLDLTQEIICTIDPDDAKDYDDAISLKKLPGGEWELGVHIADVSFFVPEGSPLDLEAQKRGNSAYFPGHVIPMLPEILSNGVCSLQEAVPRLCKTAFITLDEDARPTKTRFANTIIHSRKRLRYREAQAIIDGLRDIPHPDGPRRIDDYPQEVVSLLHDMDHLAKRIQKRRRAAGQLTLNLPEVELILDEDGKVIGTEQEDSSFTHTLIEMFMVEANEAVARMLDRLDVPFLRRVHPEPEMQSSERLRHFVQVAGYKMPKVMDRKALQVLLDQVKDKPESFAVNIAILKSLTRAEYSPEKIGHYALASEHYGHFTSPIRRYADLTIHRLLDAYFEAGGQNSSKRLHIEGTPSYDDLKALGRQISFTERRAEDAERELRQVKILELLSKRIGEEFEGVITGITNFGVFVQIREYLVDGLIRYEDLMDDWWDVDERAGQIRGQRTGNRIGIGDLAKVLVVRVDVPRRELQLSITELKRRSGAPMENPPAGPKKKGGGRPKASSQNRGGGSVKKRQGKKRR